MEGQPACPTAHCAWPACSVFSYARFDLLPCEDLQPLWRVPAGIAVAKNNTQLLDVLSAAMMRLVVGGPNATILAIEKEVRVGLGNGGAGLSMLCTFGRVRFFMPGM
jgi:hypothetical protein